MTPSEKMQLVINLARTAMDQGELPIAAMVFHNDQIISSAYTLEKAEKRFLVHAELLALMDADKQDLPFNVRGELELYTNLEPCMMCLGAAMSCFVGSVFYSLEAPMDGAVSFAQLKLADDSCDEIPSYNLPKITSGILREESRKLFAEYAQANIGNPMYDFAKSLADL